METGTRVFVFVCIGTAIVFAAVLADRCFNGGKIAEKIGLEPSGDTSMPMANTVEELDIIEIEEQEDCGECTFPNEMLETYAPEQTSSKYSDLQGY